MLTLSVLPDLSALHIVIGILEQSQNNVLDVLADVTGFGQRRRVRDAERHIENSGHGFREQGFARARWADQQNVTLLDLYIRQRVRLKSS